MNKELLNRLIKKAANLEQTTIQVDNFAFHASDFEKFAELIVEECINDCVRCTYRHGDSEHNRALMMAVEEIKKHFRVN